MPLLSDLLSEYDRPQGECQITLPKGEVFTFRVPAGSKEYKLFQADAIEFAKKVVGGKSEMGLKAMRLGIESAAKAFLASRLFVSFDPKVEKVDPITSMSQSDWLDLASDRWQLFDGIMKGLSEYLDQTVFISFRAQVEDTKKNSPMTQTDSPNSMDVSAGTEGTPTKLEETPTPSE